MFESETQLLLKMVLEQLSKKFSPIFNSLRVPLAISIGERKNKRRSKANYVAAAFSDSFFLVKSLLFNKIKGKNIKSVSQKFVFVIDHNREPFINLFLEILRAIPANDVCIFTINRSIYKRLIKDNVYKVIYINNLTNFNLKVVNSLRKVDSEIINIDRAMPIFDRISVFTDILKVVCYENFYEKILSNDICSVVTLCDANLHEQVITRVANKKCVSTYTLQHGMINMLWFPIVSNYFFVWNKHTKEICNKKYGVNDSQMIITGNPFIEAQEIDRIQNKSKEKMDTLKNELFAYVKENTFKETDSLQSDTKIFVEGILDSMGFALLLDFLETKFQIQAEDSDLVEENFESIDAIADFIGRKNPELV